MDIQKRENPGLARQPTYCTWVVMVVVVVVVVVSVIN